MQPHETPCNPRDPEPNTARDAAGHIPPHGGRLVDLTLTDAARRRDLVAACAHAHECSERNACDVELLTVGGFSPLEGFMGRDVYDHVVKNMRWVVGEGGGRLSGGRAGAMGEGAGCPSARDLILREVAVPLS